MLLLVYGTLKKGKYNHTRLGMDNQKFLSKQTIKGVSLVQPAHVPYPYCIEDSSGQVVCELYETNDKEFIASLDRIEKGAGYKRIEVELDDLRVANIYVDASGDTYPNLKRFEEF